MKEQEAAGNVRRRIYINGSPRKETDRRGRASVITRRSARFLNSQAEMSHKASSFRLTPWYRIRATEKIEITKIIVIFVISIDHASAGFVFSAMGVPSNCVILKPEKPSL
jgi:hypothetical protein